MEKKIQELIDELKSQQELLWDMSFKAPEEVERCFHQGRALMVLRIVEKLEKIVEEK